MADHDEKNPQIERRFVQVELRALQREAQDGASQPVIEGMAAVFNQETVIGRWFREQIEPGAFKRVLSEKPDVVAAFNHDWNIVLGRTTAQTLALRETAKGLAYTVDINPEDPEAMSVYAKVQRGDVRQSSFAFTVREEKWTQPPENSKELPLRSIMEIDELFDVSPVTFPAYPQTSAAVRSKAESLRAPQPPEPEHAASGDAEAKDMELATRQKMRRRRLQLIEAEQPHPSGDQP